MHHLIIYPIIRSLWLAVLLRCNIATGAEMRGNSEGMYTWTHTDSIVHCFCDILCTDDIRSTGTTHCDRHQARYTFEGG
jgi:hypothetical protein